MFWANGYEKDSKISRLAAWKQVEKTTGQKPQALIDMPETTWKEDYLWRLYISIKNGCGDRVTFEALKARESVTGERLTPWEAELMIKIDNVRLQNG